MDDDFGLQTNDTTPITAVPGSGGEDTPLKGSLPGTHNDRKAVDSPHKTNESIGKYKDLEKEMADVNDTTKIGSIQLQFSPRNNGSTWSLQSSTASTATRGVRWYRHPKVREHWKVVVASFVLFFIGLCLCIAGIILEALQVQLGGIFMLFVIGIFCFIPGVYHVIAVYYAVKGKRGFSFYNLPLFN